jgi:hypothetical protein
MIITTRSSIRVKPFWLLRRFRNLSSMVLLSYWTGEWPASRRYRKGATAEQP